MKIICRVQTQRKRRFKASVNIQYKDQSIQLEFNRKENHYEAETPLNPGDKFTFEVTAEGFESLKQTEFASEKIYELTIARSGKRYRRNGSRMKPVSAYEGVFVIVGNKGKAFDQLIDSFDLIPTKHFEGEKLDANNLYIINPKVNKGNSKRKQQRFKETLSQLRKSSLTDFAGPLAEIQNKEAVSYSPVIKVYFKKETTSRQIKSLIRDCGFEMLEKNQDGYYLINTGDDCGYELFDHLEALHSSDIVELVFPVFQKMTPADTVPSNFLWKGQYTHKVIETEQAWSLLEGALDASRAFGNGDVIVAVTDNGLIPRDNGDGTFTQHESFMVTVTAGDLAMPTTPDKINSLQDYRSASFNADNNTSVSDSTHGANVCGIISASPNIVNGTAGVAGNTQLSSFIIQTIADDKKVDAIYCAAGLRDYTDGTNTLTKSADGFDVLVSSIAYDIDSTKQLVGGEEVILDKFRDLITALTTRGRKGRGVLMVFSAGNESTSYKHVEPASVGDTENNRYSVYDGVISVGATGFYPDSPDEIKSIYSSTGKIDFCAPSSNGGGWLGDHDPPRNARTWTTTTPGKGDLPGALTAANSKVVLSAVKESFPFLETGTVDSVFPKATVLPVTDVIGSISDGDTDIDVDSVVNFKDGMSIVIRKDDDDKTKSQNAIIETVNTDSFTISSDTPITDDYDAPQEIVGWGVVPKTTITATINPSDATISVDSTESFVAGMRIALFNPTTNTINETVLITGTGTGVLNIDVSTPITGTHSAPYEILGLTTISISTTGLFTFGQALLLEYREQNRSLVQTGVIYGINLGASEIYVYGVDGYHRMENGRDVQIRAFQYGWVSSTVNYFPPLPANYAPNGALSVDIAPGDAAVTVTNPGDFVHGCLIKVESGGNVEWKRVTNIIGNDLMIDFGEAFVHPHTIAGVNPTTITGYPILDANISNRVQPLQPNDHLNVTNSAGTTKVDIEIFHEHVFSGTWAFHPLSTAIPSETWDSVSRVAALKLNNLVGISEDDTLLLSEPEYFSGTKTENSETVKVERINAAESIIYVDRFQRTHVLAPNLDLLGGELDYSASFGGTSSASPTVGGVIALVLSANPDLTWAETIDVLRRSADKIDLNTKGYHGALDDTTGYETSKGHRITYSPSDADPTLRPLREGQWKNKAGDFIYLADGVTASGVLDTEAYHSDWYGYGRVNAKKAVQKAIEYSHSDRDLVIRNTLADDGTVATAAGVIVNSPDIWVRNIDPGLDDDFSTLDYTHSPPHQKPIKNGERYIYARIKNIGTSFKNLEAKVRFYLVLTPAPDFKFPEHFTDSDDGAVGAGLEGVKFLDEVPIEEDEIDTEGVKVVHIPWPADASDVETGLQTHILVEVTPHDGPFLGPDEDGSTLAYNNNLSAKRMLFRDEIEIRDDETTALPSLVTVPSDDLGTLIATGFEVDLADNFNFTTENVTVKVTRHLLGDDPPETIEYRYDTGSWSFDAIPTGGWLIMSDPRVEPYGAMDLATLDQKSIRFNGTFSVDGTVDKIIIQCEYTNTNGDARSNSKTVDVRVVYESGFGSDSEPIDKNKAYFFTEYHLFNDTQTHAESFGPNPTTPTVDYRLTSMHSAHTQNPKTFAVTDGQIFVQQTSDPTLVNVILKPRYQGGIDFLDVKYFIYRGVLKNELISDTDPQLIAPATKNDFVASIWETQEAINDAIENADDSDGITPGSVTDQPSSLSLGIQYVASAVEPWEVEKVDTDFIDELFFDGSSNYKFPPIKAGQSFGKFDMSSFGFEIVLNTASSKTTFGEVRAVERTVSIPVLTGTPTALDKLQDRSDRHVVLEYMDPAAYYGVHTYSGIHAFDAAGDEQLFIGDDAYENIIDLFFNKNRTYIDIRNENGYSFNYYDNYTDSGQDIKLSFDETLSPAAELFGTSGWPIRIVENAELAGGNVGSKNRVIMEFPKGDIQSSIVYKAFASSYKRFPKLPRRRKKFEETEFDGANLYSEPLEFGLPNREDDGDTRAIAWYLKLDYIRRNNVANVAGNTMVMNGVNALDNVFTISDNIPWDSTDQILFNSGFQNTFLQKEDLSCYGELGFAKEASRVMFYFVPETVNFQPTKHARLYKNVGGGTSNKASFFEVLKHTFPDFTLLKEELLVSGSPITYLRYEDGTKLFRRLLDKNNFISVGISQVEYDSLTASATTSSLDESLHDLVLVVKSKNVLTDDNGLGYFKYEIGLAGINTSGDYTITPASVEVYSVDGTMLTSNDFADAETSAELGEDCITFGSDQGADIRTVFGQVIKRVSLYTDTTGATQRSWKMYKANGSDLNYTNTDVSNFGDPLDNTTQIELPVGTRVILLSCKTLGVDTLGSVNYIRVVTYYNGDFREGYISENAIKNSTDERTLSPDGILPDEQFDTLLNDIKLDTYLARRITTDPSFGANYPSSDDFEDVLTELEDQLDPSEAGSIVSRFNGLDENGKFYWISVLRTLEATLKFDTYEDQEEGIRIDYPSTATKFMNFIDNTVGLQPLDQEMTGDVITPLFVPINANWSGYVYTNLAGYNDAITEFFKTNAPLLLDSMYGTNGNSVDNGVGIGADPDFDFADIIDELKLIRSFLTLTTVGGLTLSADDPVLQTKEAKWFINDTSDAYFDSITDLFFVWNQAWKDQDNPSHLRSDFRAGYIGVDCSLGFVNSNNVLCVLAHELNVGDGNVVRLADDTHTYDSEVPVREGSSDTKFVSQTAWEYVKENDFDTFNGHGFLLPSPITNGDGQKLGNDGYSATKNVCDFLQRNPSIGVLYAKYILDNLPS